MDVLGLRLEVLGLRNRVERLVALLRLVVVLPRVSRFSLTCARLPDAAVKISLLRAIDRSRSVLPLRAVLRVLRLSPSRYDSWKRQDECGLDDMPSCPRSSPQLLVDGGVENYNGAVDKLVDSGVLQRLLAVTEISFSNSLIQSWWRALKHQWLFLNTLDTVSRLEKLVTFYVDEHNTRFPHSAFRGQTPDEMYFGNGATSPMSSRPPRKSLANPG